jgi:hypothetical protein
VRIGRQEAAMITMRSVFHALPVAAVCFGMPYIPETFRATATMTTAGGTKVTSPVTVTVDRATSDREAETLSTAFKTAGTPALRKALEGMKPTGTIQIGDGPLTPTRITLDRTTDTGRLLTIVTDVPLVFLGAGTAHAKPREGYEFAVLDLEIGRDGSGWGLLAPAARITIKQGVFIVEDYASEPVRLTSVTAR